MIAFEWMAHNNARNLLLLGDLAVYLLGRRCWEGSVGGKGEDDRMRLDPAIARHAEARAAAARISVEESVNRALGERIPYQRA